MKITSSVASLIAICLCLMLQKPAYADGDCHVEKAAGYPLFVRKHEVGNYRNEPVERGTDELVLWFDPSGKQNFCLYIVDTNFHQCYVSGPLAKAPKGALIFADATGCSLVFHRTRTGYFLKSSGDWSRASRCQENYCGMFASVRSGSFEKPK